MQKLVLLAALMLLVVPTAYSGGRRPAAPPNAEVAADGDLEKITADEPSGSVGFLYTPKSLAEGEKGGLVVMLHGHGGTPKGVVLRQAAETMGWLWLSVQGGTELSTPQGTGYQWDTRDVDKVLALTRWVLANRPVDSAKVVLFGFSAGGTMVLETYPKAPELFAGVMTNSSPRTPEKRHETARMVVFLGTEDPNFQTAPTVRNAFEGRRVGATLQIMEGAVHNDLAKPPYVCLALQWILKDGTRGNEVRYPKDPPDVKPAGFRHISVAWTGAKEAPRDLRRKKSTAKSLAKTIQKLVEKGKAWFPHEAQAWSSDAASAPLGGFVTRERLLSFGIDGEKLDKALSRLDEGEVAGPLESEYGYHLVVPVPAEGGD